MNKTLTTQVTCYKLVLRRPNDTLVSLTAQCLPAAWRVEYVIGKPAYPPLTGELFAFDTEESATSHKSILGSSRQAFAVELYEALANAPVHPIDTACSLGAWPDDFHDFWNPNSLCHDTHATPPGTITTRSLTLIKRLS